jgi:hypothetical protein
MSATPLGPHGRHDGRLGITGSLGTISLRDRAPRRTWWARLLTFAAILGPGIIVMTGDNYAGGVQTYTQAGQQYGNSLMWVLAALFVVLFVAQEMVTQLGAVTGVGHARLIRERFGRFWNFFSVRRGATPHGYTWLGAVRSSRADMLVTAMVSAAARAMTVK